MKFIRILSPVILTLVFSLSSAQIVTFVSNKTTGCDSLLVTFTFIDASGTDTIKTVDWDFGNGQKASGKNQQVVLYDSAALYDVTVTINNNRVIKKSNLIAVYPSPDPFFLYSDTIDVGSYTVVMQNVHQDVDSIRYTYLWDFGDGESASTRMVSHTFPDEGRYDVSLIVTSEIGCSASDTINIEVLDMLEYTNVFTPNDDNKNDHFIVLTNGVTVYSIEIFSRSGTLVFKGESPTIIWDGRNMSGQKLPADVYFFVITPVGGTGGRKTSGIVHLFR